MKAVRKLANGTLETFIQNGAGSGSAGGVDQSQVEQIVAGYITAHKEELKGDKGDTGAALTFDDLTDSQKAQLKGEKGDPGDAASGGLTEAEVEQKIEEAFAEFPTDDVVNDIIDAKVKNMAYVTKHVGDGEPDASLGDDGDIYIDLTGESASGSGSGGVDTTAVQAIVNNSLREYYTKSDADVAVQDAITKLNLKGMAYSDKIVGQGAPDAFMGKDGDFYIDLDGTSSSGGGAAELPELTEEHVVGYLNGKPVYERLWLTTLPQSISSGQKLMDFPDCNIPDVDTFICATGSLDSGSNIRILPYAVGSSIFNALYFNSETSCIATVSVGAVSVGKRVVIVARYTKNTD